MIFHQLFKKNKNKFFVILSILFIGNTLFLVCTFNNDNYSSNIKNNTRNLNTALLNNIYIGVTKDDKVIEEENIQKESNIIINDYKYETNNSVKKEPNNTIIPASTTTYVNPQPEQNQTLEGVYVGLKFTGSMTAYGKDCCGSDPSHQGITSSGYDLKQSINYNDPTYGNVRIVASDRNFKLYSIIRVNDPIDGVYNAIVLDRAGSVIGLNKIKKFDLAVESEAYAASSYGVHNNVSFEVLRVGR